MLSASDSTAFTSVHSSVHLSAQAQHDTFLVSCIRYKPLPMPTRLGLTLTDIICSAQTLQPTYKLNTLQPSVMPAHAWNGYGNDNTMEYFTDPTYSYTSGSQMTNESDPTTTTMGEPKLQQLSSKGVYLAKKRATKGMRKTTSTMASAFSFAAANVVSATKAAAAITGKVTSTDQPRGTIRRAVQVRRRRVRHSQRRGRGDPCKRRCLGHKARRFRYQRWKRASTVDSHDGRLGARGEVGRVEDQKACGRGQEGG